MTLFFAVVMAQHAKKRGAAEVDVFARLRDRKAEEAKKAGQTPVPNLTGPVVDVYAPRPPVKRPAPSKLKGVGKDRKRLKYLAKSGGVGGSTSGGGGTGLSRYESLELRKGLEMKLSDREMQIIEGSDPALAMKGMMEYLSRGIALGQLGFNLLHAERSSGEKQKALDEVAALREQLVAEKASWDEERKKLEEKVRSVTASADKRVKALRAEMAEVEEQYKIEAENHKAEVEELKAEIEGLEESVISEHIKGFEKALR